MRAAVTKDSTVRTIDLEVKGVPDIDVTQTWHAKPRLFRPRSVTIRVIDGETRNILIKGGLVLKSGEASAHVGESRDYRSQHYDKDRRVETAPEWVRRLWNEAPAGVISWNEPEPQTL
jgi:hypothetical protein